MKGKLNCMWPMSHEESLKKGTEVEIVASMGMHYLCRIPSGKQVPISISAVDVTDFTPIIDWEQRRYEIAKECFAGLYNRACDDSLIQWNHQKMAKTAVYLADELIKQLKK